MTDNNSTKPARWRIILDTVSALAMTVAAIVVTALGVRLLWAPASGAAQGGNEAPLPKTPVRLEGAAIKGRTDAPLVLLEYSDFQCPVCRRFAVDVLPTVESRYLASGKVEFAFRHFPLQQIHEHAMAAAKAAECARQQGKFWPMHDLLFADQERLNAEHLTERANRLGLDLQAFGSCVESKAEAAVAQDIAAGRALELHGTPTIFIGLNDQIRGARLIKRFSGMPPLEQLTVAIDEALRSILPSQDRSPTSTPNSK
ncbi:MAG TPA: thioredoxin domain-containing protein [Vicinamibacterales bacterium]|nr:thioredoxin domain-containing protein [Vicinamibacterales bacterium]